MSVQRNICLGLLLIALLSCPAIGQPVGVAWRSSLEAATTEAGQSGRMVLVHFWTEDCPPCAALEKSVFSQSGVGSAIEAKFVPVKLNANEHPEVATAMGITRVPTDVILNAQGQVVGSLVSPATPMAYVAELTQLAEKHSGQMGRAFSMAAAAAPLPAQINPAYADLKVDPWTPPVVATMAQPVVGERYASAGSPGAAPGQSPAPMPAGAPAPAKTPAPPATVNNRYAEQAASMASSPPLAAASPIAATPASAAVPAPGAAPAGGQVTNPYAAAPANRYAEMASLVASTGAPSATNASRPPAAAAPDPSRLPPGAPPLGFDGYCPVSMRKVWQWVPGNPQYGAIHRGRTYWFAGAHEQQQFLANPDYYGPALSGIDPVMALEHRQQVTGRREHSIDYDNLFYMFSSEATLQQFTANPERIATSVRQAMGLAPGGAIR